VKKKLKPEEKLPAWNPESKARNMRKKKVVKPKQQKKSRGDK
jgi:hypothetical protein